MVRIRIKEFGPIKNSCLSNQGMLDVKKVTVFIGNQGAGKSTVAKLISTLTWLEKALIRGDVSYSDLTLYKRFQKKFCGYQNITNYFRPETDIVYKGTVYTFIYRKEKLNIVKPKSENYIAPKIMYVPAERNFISVVDKPSLLKNLPSTLYTFLDEYENAKESIGNVDLPLENVKFQYQKNNKTAYLIGEDYKIKLSEGSSGFQSFVPLYLVTRYLAQSIKQESDPSKKSIDIKLHRKMKQQIEEILGNKKLSEEIKRVSLEYLSDRFTNSCFVNIVEEPEQNLYPDSQKKVLFELFRYANLNLDNKLILTTHSPYIISYLSLAIKGFQVKELLPNSDKDFRPMLNKVVPLESCISPEDCAVYEITDTGEIKQLDTFEGIPTDSNFLNNRLAKSNELFDDLLEIEELCQ